jgi:hypothetical protein
MDEQIPNKKIEIFKEYVRIAKIIDDAGFKPTPENVSLYALGYNAAQKEQNAILDKAIKAQEEAIKKIDEENKTNIGDK